MTRKPRAGSGAGAGETQHDPAAGSPRRPNHAPLLLFGFVSLTGVVAYYPELRALFRPTKVTTAAQLDAKAVAEPDPLNPLAPLPRTVPRAPRAPAPPGLPGAPAPPAGVPPMPPIPGVAGLPGVPGAADPFPPSPSPAMPPSPAAPR